MDNRQPHPYTPGGTIEGPGSFNDLTSAHDGSAIGSPGFLFDLWEQAREASSAAQRAKLHHPASAPEIAKAITALEKAATHLKRAHDQAKPAT